MNSPDTAVSFIWYDNLAAWLPALRCHGGMSSMVATSRRAKKLGCSWSAFSSDCLYKFCQELLV